MRGVIVTGLALLGAIQFACAPPPQAAQESLPVKLLRLAAAEAATAKVGKSDLAPFNLLARIVEAQGEAKDVEGLKASEEIAARMPKEGLVMQFNGDCNYEFAAAFARAGDMDSYRSHLAKVAGRPVTRELAYAYAAAGDYAAMDKTLEDLNPTQKLIACLEIAKRVAGYDAAKSAAMMKEAETLWPVNAIPNAEREVAGGSFDVNDAPTVIARWEAVKSDYGPDYSGLEFGYILRGDAKSAQLVREHWLAAIEKNAKSKGTGNFLVFKNLYLAGDFKAARAMLPGMIAAADALPKGGDSPSIAGIEVQANRSLAYAGIAERAARVGDDVTANACIERSIAATGWGAGSVGNYQRMAVTDDVRRSWAMWLASQGRRDDALAVIGHINTDNERQDIALHYLIHDAVLRGDVLMAVAALPRIVEPMRRAGAASTVAALVANPEVNDPKGPGAIDPMKWALSLPAATDRAEAALALATAMRLRAGKGL